HPAVRDPVLPHDPAADEAREGAESDDRSAAEGRRSGHRRRPGRSHHQARRAVRDARDRARHRDRAAALGGTGTASQGNAQDAAVNRFPTWKYALIALAIALAFLYTLPNFFGESPAVQVASGKSTVRLDTAVVTRIEQALQSANIHATGLIVDQTGVRVRF